jgi:hypothetical protein
VVKQKRGFGGVSCNQLAALSRAVLLGELVMRRTGTFGMASAWMP